MSKKKKFLLVAIIFEAICLVGIIIEDIIAKTTFFEALKLILPVLCCLCVCICVYANEKEKTEPKEEKREVKTLEPKKINNPVIEKVFEEEKDKDARYKRLQALRIEGSISSRDYAKAIEMLDE